MFFDWLFHQKRPHAEVRYVVPTRREKIEALKRQQALQASVRAQLAVYNAVTTPEQRVAEREAYWATQRLMRMQGRG